MLIDGIEVKTGPRVLILPSEPWWKAKLRTVLRKLTGGRWPAKFPPDGGLYQVSSGGWSAPPAAPMTMEEIEQEREEFRKWGKDKLS